MEKNHRGTAQKKEAGMMGQRQREQVQRGCAVGTVVLLAWLCRVLPLEGLPSGLQEACGILRSLLYLSLFAGWGISLYNRTVHPQVRRLLLNVDLLMLFWILVRTLRFQLNTPPEIDRMLGYLYYAPMLGIPVLCVQLVLTVDRSEPTACLPGPECCGCPRRCCWSWC